jgi:hypothetical protein
MILLIPVPICCVEICIIQLFSERFICSKDYLIFSQIMWLEKTILVHTPAEQKISNTTGKISNTTFLLGKYSIE